VTLFIFGHRHIELDLMLSRTARLVVLGDCYSHFTYGVLDDKGFRLDNFA
jgi:UDP-2,3-diacylglucosamine hydrolase